MSNSNEDENMRLLYQVYIDDIRFSKQQQWNTLYLTLLAISGIIALSIYLPYKLGLTETTELQHIKRFLTLICLLVSSLGILFLTNYYFDIKRYRNKLKVLSGKLKVPIKEKKRDARLFLILFSLVIALAELLCIWAIWEWEIKIRLWVAVVLLVFLCLCPMGIAYVLFRPKKEESEKEAEPVKSSVQKEKLERPKKS